MLGRGGPGGAAWCVAGKTLFTFYIEPLISANISPRNLSTTQKAFTTIHAGYSPSWGDSLCMYLAVVAVVVVGEVGGGAGR